jgi:uncharacterized OsmC-like protein
MKESHGDDRIGTAFERNRKALGIRPTIGQKTAITRARVVDGLRCEIEDGRWTLVADASDKSGGTGTGPDPGMIGRAALASCLAMGYVMWASHLNVPLERIEVEVQADFDVRGQYGHDGVRPGYNEIRCIVHIDSPAPEVDVHKVVDAADGASMYWDAFANPTKLVRQLQLNCTR